MSLTLNALKKLERNGLFPAVSQPDPAQPDPTQEANSARIVQSRSSSVPPTGKASIPVDDAHRETPDSDESRLIETKDDRQLALVEPSIVERVIGELDQSKNMSPSADINGDSAVAPPPAFADPVAEPPRDLPEDAVEGDLLLSADAVLIDSGDYDSHSIVERREAEPRDSAQIPPSFEVANADDEGQGVSAEAPPRVSEITEATSVERVSAHEDADSDDAPDTYDPVIPTIDGWDTDSTEQPTASSTERLPPALPTIELNVEPVQMEPEQAHAKISDEPPENEAILASPVEAESVVAEAVVAEARPSPTEKSAGDQAFRDDSILKDLVPLVEEPPALDVEPPQPIDNERIKRTAVTEPTSFEREITRCLQQDAGRKPLLLLRDEVEYRNGHRWPITLLVASQIATDRTAELLTHLAFLLAESQAHILLVDANLAEQSLTRRFGALGEVGLCDALKPESPFDVGIRPTSLRNLNFLPCGDDVLGISRVTEALDVDRLERAIDLWQNEYHYVLVDGGCIDSALISPFGERLAAAMLLISQQSNDADLMRKASERLSHSCRQVLGCVVTDSPQPALA